MEEEDKTKTKKTSRNEKMCSAKKRKDSKEE